jgi:LmbE family N-acetylglucosaminyl deacetylase
MTKSVLVIAAHPDDEVLGCGGTIAKLSEEGAKIHVAFMSDGVYSRTNSQNIELDKRRTAAQNACNILGVNTISFDDFPDNRMDTVALLDITKRIELLITQYEPELIFTHHAGDVNVDHRKLNEAVATACRPQAGETVKTILCFEVASSTEWQLPGTTSPFSPNWFIDISKTFERKLKALEEYKEELRLWPHPRSLKGVSHLNQWRGATVGVNAAEAFMLGRHIS